MAITKCFVSLPYNTYYAFFPYRVVFNTLGHTYTAPYWTCDFCQIMTLNIPSIHEDIAWHNALCHNRTQVKRSIVFVQFVAGLNFGWIFNLFPSL